ncbi:HAD family acid phosphatase [Rhodanobacter sp. DHG33]|uniref:5'-nucleotidase, lipoprotein e(P4) family n=1 Tax=Rhodanobacter sp. DHG33 TaxID=2775921 RepID=UPI001783FA65|nr:HAD family acid phosphatase [Rhodanobacter sp. DHG33]MBD8899569.1 acid phosphatase [Rhodanobacter sp. DHG33]
MRLHLPLALAASVLLAGCASAPTHPAAASAPAPVSEAAANDNLNAVAWTQTAIEHDLIYIQAYRDAQSRLLEALHDPNWDALSKDDRVTPATGLPAAVVLDIDETVLDNSPYQARLVKSGGSYDEASWAAWCKEQRARAMPGALAFTQFAAAHGIAVIYLSNRAQDLDTATLANLRQLGFPVSGPDAFLGLGTVEPGCDQVGTEKGCRRQLVSRKYRVLMQFGDQLGDFVDVLANTEAGRKQAIADYMGWIGTRWFVLPNPTYGSWEPALFNNDWSAPATEQRQKKLDSLRYN